MTLLLRSVSAVRILAVSAACLTTACTYSLPLGGVSPGRGRPLGEDRLQIGASFGTSPEMAGTLQRIDDQFANEVNPVAPTAARTARAGKIDPLGFTYGFTDWFDLGLSFSRGLHSFIRVAGTDTWAISLSPAVFRYSSEDGEQGGRGRRRGAVTSGNGYGLVSFLPRRLDDGWDELYAGAGLSKTWAWIETDVNRVEASDVFPSVVAGVRKVRFGAEGHEPGSTSSDLTFSLAFEVGGTWIAERGMGASMVPTVRFFLAIGGMNRKRRR